MVRALLFTALMVVGCGDAGRPVGDAAGDMAPLSDMGASDADAAPDQQSGKLLIPGVYDIPGVVTQAEFLPLAEGDPIYVGRGFQGGLWVHLALRTKGMPDEGKVTATIEHVGVVEQNVKMFAAEDGLLEARYITVRVEDPEAEDYLEQMVSLEMRYDAGGQTVSATRTVLLKQFDER